MTAPEHYPDHGFHEPYPLPASEDGQVPQWVRDLQTTGLAPGEPVPPQTGSQNWPPATELRIAKAVIADLMERLNVTAAVITGPQLRTDARESIQMIPTPDGGVAVRMES